VHPLSIGAGKFYKLHFALIYSCLDSIQKAAYALVYFAIEFYFELTVTFRC